MILSELMQFLHIACEDNRVLKGISDDSRVVCEDWLFVCRDGYQGRGVTYIQEALAKGAIVLCDEDVVHPDVYLCEHVEYIMHCLLELFYGDLCSGLRVVGVTGTSGKTSVASIITQLFTMNSYATLRIGTHEVVWPDHTDETSNTTPGCFMLANLFKEAIEKGITHVVMEVSSHAIDQNRISFLQFDTIVYTNITQDHLDYHLTKTHYRYTKFKLRRYVKPQGAIIYNNDLPYMMELVNLAHHTCISVGCTQAHFTIQDITLHAQGLAFQMQGEQFTCALLSMVNVYNLAQALAVCRRFDIPYEDLITYTSKLQPVAGRLEIIPSAHHHIWLDYAHTPDALQTLLQFAGQISDGHRIITVIGCGGNRDRKKRPIMAQIACDGSNLAILTADNPREELIQWILQDMLLDLQGNYEVFENRSYAIKHAVEIAEKNDIIIIAGKGNENTQEIQGVVYPFSDSACIQERLKKEE